MGILSEEEVNGEKEKIGRGRKRRKRRRSLTSYE
jgi:hypothetical protein